MDRAPKSCPMLAIGPLAILLHAFTAHERMPYTSNILFKETQGLALYGETLCADSEASSHIEGMASDRDHGVVYTYFYGSPTLLINQELDMATYLKRNWDICEKLLICGMFVPLYLSLIHI